MNGRKILKDFKGEIMNEEIRIEIERLLLKAIKHDDKEETERLMKLRVDIAHIKGLNRG